MKVKDYKSLILALPVHQQAFSTKRATWAKAEIEIYWLKSLNNFLFNDTEPLTISRQDVFASATIRELILKTLYWGYPAGMRGNHFINILTQIDEVEQVLIGLHRQKHLSGENYVNAKSEFCKIKGLGLSTFSKLLYFSKFGFDTNPCVILDYRIINVLSNSVFDEFHSLRSINKDNARFFYLDFLNKINQVAIELNTTSENIEQFIYTFGLNLKP